MVARHPELTLRIALDGAGAFDDLAFLEHLPHLRGLNVDGNHPLDLSPIRRFVALERLVVGGLGTSLRLLEGYASLKDLFVRERIKDLDAIATLRGLRALTIGGRSLIVMVGEGGAALPGLPDPSASCRWLLAERAGTARLIVDLATVMCPGETRSRRRPCKVPTSWRS
ncbi:MAG TPA: hypothetical protein VLT45_15810, partial [Kofleriaceae bacterium]|nr:hypothetical protein [Kofleriaceae bacterium]